MCQRHEARRGGQNQTANRILAGILFLVAALAHPAQAAGNQERLKGALNEIVQEVREAESPAAKRAILDRFLSRADRNTRLLEALPGAGDGKKAALGAFQERFAGYSAQLHGTEGKQRVADNELDAFATFMQQDLEQAAEVEWGSGGIYLSVGAVIIILLILILVT
jgi:hypothetical protein